MSPCSPPAPCSCSSRGISIITGLIVILVTLTLGFVMRMMEKPEEHRWGRAPGLLMALALTIALETLPWLLLISGWLGLWATAKGRTAARNAPRLWACAPYLRASRLLLRHRPATLQPACAGCPDLFHRLCHSDRQYCRSLRRHHADGPGAACLALAGRGRACRVLTGFFFLHRFPDLISGPYGGMDPALAADHSR